MAWNEGIKAFVTAGAVAAYRRVTMAADGTINYSGDDEVGHGVSLNHCSAAGDHCSVKLINCAGTFEIEAAGAIAKGAAVYAAPSGKVQALPAAPGTYYRVGTALEAASGDGAVIEVLPDDHVSTTTVS